MHPQSCVQIRTHVHTCTHIPSTGPGKHTAAATAAGPTRRFSTSVGCWFWKPCHAHAHAPAAATILHALPCSAGKSTVSVRVMIV